MATNELLFTCITQELQRKDRHTVAADAEQTVIARFALCPEWDGLNVYARFFCPGEPEPLTLKVEGKTCTVPWEALYKPGTFEVAIFGEGESGERLTSSRARVEVVQSVEYDEHPPVDYDAPEPTPTLLQNIEQAAAQAAADAQAAREAAERAEEAAGTGGSGLVIGHGLAYDSATNTLSVDTAGEVEQDNTLPITSGAVYTELGGISALLATI